MKRLWRSVLYLCILVPLVCSAGPSSSEGRTASGGVAMVLPSAGELLGEGRPVSEGEFLGLVQDGRFLLLVSGPGQESQVRLTSIGMQQAVSPESGELDLSAYEGRAIMVRGQEGGDWVYSAEVIDEASPILTAVVRQLFEPMEPGD